MNLLFRKRDLGAFCIDMLFVSYAYMASVGVVLPKGSEFGVGYGLFTFALAIYYGFIVNRFRSKFLSVYLFLFFVFFLILLESTNLYQSYRYWMRLSGLLSLPAGFVVFHSLSNVHRYLNVLIAIVHFYLVYIILANVMHFGGGYGYDQAEFETGNLFANALFTNVYILTIMPFLVRLKSRKAYLMVVLGICAVVVIVNMKRVPIACGIVAAFTYLLVSHYMDFKFGSLVSRSGRKYIFAFVLVFGCSFLLSQDTIEEQIEIRQKKFKKSNIDREGRVLEFVAIYNENVKGGSLKKLLFGKETFNTVGNYGNGSFGKRQIHQDFALLLHSTGIVGLFWYLGIQMTLLILPFRRKYKSLFLHNETNRILLGIYVSLIVAHFVAMTSGVIRMSFSETVYYMSLGMILRIFYEQYYHSCILGKSLK